MRKVSMHLCYCYYLWRKPLTFSHAQNEWWKQENSSKYTKNSSKHYDHWISYEVFSRNVFSFEAHFSTVTLAKWKINKEHVHVEHKLFLINFLFLILCLFISSKAVQITTFLTYSCSYFNCPILLLFQINSWIHLKS